MYVSSYVNFFFYFRWDFVPTPGCGFTLILCLGRTAVSTKRFVSVFISKLHAKYVSLFYHLIACIMISMREDFFKIGILCLK